jgi:hypothetical protein
VIREKIKKLLEFQKRKAQTYQNLWDTAKAVLRRKFIAMNAYVTKKKISQKRPNTASQSPRKIRTS